jgi:hypothetical protein
VGTYSLKKLSNPYKEARFILSRRAFGASFRASIFEVQGVQYPPAVH